MSLMMMSHWLTLRAHSTVNDHRVSEAHRVGLAVITILVLCRRRSGLRTRPQAGWRWFGTPNGCGAGRPPPGRSVAGTILGFVLNAKLNCHVDNDNERCHNDIQDGCFGIPRALQMEIFKMTQYLDRLRHEFQGNADALILKAQEVAKTLNLDQEATEGNERLLRHYVSVGVVDKPSREGRDALYGFRHLVQFVAARRLLAGGLSLAKIATYTGAVPTDALTAYLEKQGPTSEAELLVAAFRSESVDRKDTLAAPRRPAPPKPMQQVATGMGMVDVMHEMRDMESRVQNQLIDMQRKVHAMVADMAKNMGAQPSEIHVFADEFKQAMAKLANMMDEAAQRFDSLLKKPMAMIEKQMEQQRYMFEEAHRQKEFLERMFGGLLQEQRKDLGQLFEEQRLRMDMLFQMSIKGSEDLRDQMHGFMVMSEMNQKATLDMQQRIKELEYLVSDKLRWMASQQSPKPNTPTPPPTQE